MDEELNKLFIDVETDANIETVFNANNINSLEESILKIKELQSDLEVNEKEIKFLIKLDSGEYNKFFELPYNTYLHGIDKNLVIFNLDNKNDYFRLVSTCNISNITINYTNNNLEDFSKINLFYFDKYEENYFKITFNNVRFNLTDIYVNHIFDLIYGWIEFNNCIFDIKNDNKVKFEENYDLFYCDSGTKLSLKNCSINLNLNSIYYSLINSNLTNINFINCEIKYKLSDFKSYYDKDYFIINDLFSNIDFDNCKIINSSLGIKLFNLQDSLSIHNFIDYDSIVINDKVLEINNYKSKGFIEHLNGIYYNNIKYIFYDKIFLEDKVLISYNKIIPDIEIENKLLFRFNFKNCYIYNPNLETNGTYSQNYLINIVNTYFEDKIFQGLVNYYLGKDGFLIGSSISQLDGIITNNVYSDKFIGDGSSLGNIGLKKIKDGYNIDKKSIISLGKNSINFGFNNKEKYQSGDYSFITGENNICLGKNSICLGKDNINEGNLSFIFGRGNISRYGNSFILGEFNNYLFDTIFSIGNGKDENNRNNALQLSKNGILKVDKEIIVPKFTDGELNIEKGNICGAKNIEIEDNIYCSGDLYLDGKVIGKNLKTKEYIPNIREYYFTENNDIVISTVKIDLKDLLIPNNLGGIIGHNNKDSKLCNIKENINGMIYKIKLFCLETPDFQEFRFIVSNYNNLKKGALIENWSDYNKDENINMFHSYQWTKGKIKKYKEFEFNNLSEEFNIYIARMPKLKSDIKKNFEKGKFLLNIYGIKLF